MQWGEGRTLSYFARRTVDVDGNQAGWSPQPFAVVAEQVAGRTSHFREMPLHF